MIQRLITIFTILILATSATFAATQTANPLPEADANFMSDLQTFLSGENADTLKLIYGDHVIWGGIGSTAGILQHAISECFAFPEGYYTNQSAKSKTYTANTRTFVYIRYDDSVTAGVPGASVTTDEHFVYAEMAAASEMPTTPTGYCPLFYADTDGTSITAVTDLRRLKVPASYSVYDKISEIVTALGSSVKATIVVNEVIDQNVNDTITPNITLDFMDGAMHVDSGVTVTIQGSVIAPNNKQIFTGDGDVIFDSDTQTVGYVEWWGVTAGGSATTNADQIKKALDSDIYCLQFGRGTYQFDDGFDLDDCLCLRGAGILDTILEFTQTDSSDCITIVSDTRPQISNLKVTENGTTGDGIAVYNSNDGYFHNVHVDSMDSDGIAVTGTSDRNVFIGCYVTNNTAAGFLLDDVGTSTYPDNNIFQGCRSDSNVTGYDINDGSGNMIIGGVVTSNTTGIDIAAADKTFVSGTALTGNTTGLSTAATTTGAVLIPGLNTDPSAVHFGTDLYFSPALSADASDVDLNIIGGVNNAIIMPNVYTHGNSIVLPAVKGTLSGSATIEAVSSAMFGQAVKLTDQNDSIVFGDDNVIGGEWIAGATGAAAARGVRYKAYIYAYSSAGNSGNTRVIIQNETDATNILTWPYTVLSSAPIKRTGGTGKDFDVNTNDLDDSISVTIKKENNDADDIYVSHLVIVPELDDLFAWTTWDPPSIADGAESATDVTVTGAAVGDIALGAFNLDVADLQLDCNVTNADTVTCTFYNNTGGAVDLGSAALYVRVINSGE